ncbi:phosphoglycolate phosphatase [Pseudooceanicola sp. MF1-13]|uniref:phosphoglycolate phosphatase n=1 Tax=Pseudooceanicola sp. MF1-13 TaxID=3379095 RepID=UPI003891B55B
MANIVFDLDGTLIDSAPDIHGIANRLLEQEGAPPISLEQARDFIGNGASVFVERMRQARGLSDDMHDRLLADFIASYDTAVNLTVLYPGVVDALAILKAKGARLGVCTNKPLRATRAVLAHFGLDVTFDAVLGGDSLPTHKPDPAPLLATFDALGPGPRVYVGDSDVDAETARRAGIPFLLFTEGYRKSPVAELPHSATFSSFDQLVPLIQSVLEPAS